MKKFAASSKDAVISGLTLTPLFYSLLSGQYADIIKEAGIDIDSLDEWYPQQFVLDIYRKIAKTISNELALVSVGLELAGEAPPEFDSFSEYLEYLADIYEASSEGLGPDDKLFATKVTETCYEVVNSTPMPDDLIYGYLYANARRYVSSFTVSYCDLDNINSSLNMTYRIKWSE